MATTLPSLTKRIDNAFLQTWYTIQPVAIDQIMVANATWAALWSKCAKPKRGGNMITRTVKYDTKVAQAVDQTTELPSGYIESETMAWWSFRFWGTHVQRDAFKDRENSGPDALKSYVTDQLTDAQTALENKAETALWNPTVSTETGLEWQGLNDIVPAYAARATGTYGHIDRSNTWWQPQYKGYTGSVATTLVDDMRTLYNTLGKNREKLYPNLILTTQTVFETYEDTALTASQIIKQGTGPLVDLGFEVLQFKGKPMIWSENETGNNVRMLNTNYIDLVYDPAMWFDMSEWKAEANTTKRVAHILSAGNLICTRLNAQGLLY